jgi:hypothetical protein
MPAVNAMFQVYTSRLAAARRHLPNMLVCLLLASSAVAVSAVGYGCGAAGKRNMILTTALTLLIAGILWAIIDMDHPRNGLIRADQQPMLKLHQRMADPGSAP